jgi:hypothetical protein
MPPSAEQLSEHHKLLDRRCRKAILFGTFAYLLNTLEPWSDFHDLRAVKIQLTCSALNVLIAVYSYIPWGKRHLLALFTFGYFAGVAGFERIVVLEHAFGTEYSAGFTLLYAFYCVFIPIDLLCSAIVGIGVLAILTIPAVLKTGPGGILNAITSNITAFVVLLYGRHIANSLWESEFRAREREYAAMRIHANFVSMVSHELLVPLTPSAMKANGWRTERLRTTPSGQLPTIRWLEKADTLAS